MLQRWMTGLGLLLLLCATELLAASDIQNVRMWHDNDSRKTRLVFDMSAPVKYSLSQQGQPQRVVLDLEDARLRTSFQSLNLSKTPIRHITTTRRSGGGLRVELELNAAVTPNSFSLKPNGTYRHHRLVLDLKDRPQSRSELVAPAPVVSKVQAPVVRPATPSRVIPPPRSGQRDVVIAIDPGHGGKDPGALGPNGIREKDVVLKIAQELQRAINRERGFRAELVRSSDEFVDLRRRPQIAREMGADLFVSIHADAYRTPEASGASVYTLSQSGASSETARWLAASENAAGLISGVHVEDDDLNAVLLDLSMTGSLANSAKVGASVLKSMATVTRLHRRKVERAGFVVLKSPDIPSILVETGFISHPGEARNLATRRHQQALANSIQSGIRRFFLENPPHGTWLAAQRDRLGSRLAAIGSEHVVGDGESLGLIAQRYGVSVSALRRANNLRSDVIRIGQRLDIPQQVATR